MNTRKKNCKIYFTIGDKRIEKYEVLVFHKSTGTSPYLEWYSGLRDRKLGLIIDQRFTRVQVGNFGDYKSIGSGIFELRIHYGSGVRIYFSFLSKNKIIILCAGTKRSQKKDFITAKNYLTEVQNEA